MIGTETIAAIATPIGVGAVSVIRISGIAAISIVDSVFRGRQALSGAKGFTVHHGRLVDASGTIVDEVLVTVFRTPRSYTGEDLVEIGCHGGMIVTARILELLLRNGARQAEPGEFTKRAFLNGKLDLSRAEAIAELIAARSQKAMKASLNQLDGQLANRVNALKAQLVELCSLLELGLDFSEEGIELVSREEIGEKILGLQKALERLVASYESGRVIREGVSVVLVGEPNVGKSSIFNALLESDRAIVSPVPGTTRDSIEESIVIDGQLFRLTDTAGLRQTANAVEIEGVERTRKNVSDADIALIVVDASLENGGDPLELSSGAHMILARNKIDLVRNGHRIDLGKTARIPVVNVSARTGEGLEDLKRELASATFGSQVLEDEGAVVINSRHRESLSNAVSFLSGAAKALSVGQNLEVIAFELREGLNAIAGVTGEVTTDEILNAIFGKFCIGK